MPRKFKDKLSLIKVSKRRLSESAGWFCRFECLVLGRVLYVCVLLSISDDFSLFWNIPFRPYLFFHFHDIRKWRYRAGRANHSSRPTKVSLHCTRFTFGVCPKKRRAQLLQDAKRPYNRIWYNNTLNYFVTFLLGFSIFLIYCFYHFTFLRPLRCSWMFVLGLYKEDYVQMFKCSFESTAYVVSGKVGIP